MRIDVFYFAGCPNHRPAVSLVREVLHDLGFAAPLHEMEVHDLEEAKRLGFRGSPTIHVDGEDVDPTAAGDALVSFGCRLYEGSGTPPRAMIEDAIRARFGK